MTRCINIKKIIIKSLSCLLGAMIICFACNNDAFAVYCSPADKYEPSEECKLCPIFVLIFNTVSKVGDLSAEKFSTSIVKVVVVMFAIWLALEVIKFVYGMKTKDLKDLVQEIVNKGFVLVLAVMLLKAGVGNFYSVFVEPVYNTAHTVSQIMFGNADTTISNSAVSNIKEFKNGLPSSMGVSIVKTMIMMENHIKKIKALGAAAWCEGWSDRIWYIFPKFKYILFGAGVWVLATSMIVIIPYLMVDAIFQLGVAVVLMPFAVGAYVFKYTREKYCRVVIETFLNSAFSFLFMTIVAMILVSAIQRSVDVSEDAISGFDSMFVQGNAGGKTVYAKFLEKMSWGSGFLLNLGYVFILAWSVLGMAKDLASKFANSISNTQIGSELGAKNAGMVQKSINKMKPAAVYVAKKGWAGAKAGVKYMGGKMKAPFSAGGAMMAAGGQMGDIPMGAGGDAHGVGGNNGGPQMNVGAGDNDVGSMNTGAGDNDVAPMSTGAGDNDVGSMSTRAGDNDVGSMNTGAGDNNVGSMSSGTGDELGNK